MHYSSIQDAWNTTSTKHSDIQQNKKYIKIQKENFENLQNVEIEKLKVENEKLKEKLKKNNNNILGSLKKIIDDNKDIIVFILTGICIILIINIFTDLKKSAPPIIPIPSINRIMPNKFNPESVGNMAGGGVNPYVYPFHPSLYNVVH